MKNFFLLFFVSTSLLSQELKNESSISEIKSVPTNGPNQFHIDFVGTANLQQNISEANEDVQGSAGLGVIFERIFYKKDSITGRIRGKKLVHSLDMEAYINVASSIDTLRAEFDESGNIINERTFGTYILNPVSPRQSVFINANVFFNSKLNTWTKIISGLNFRVNASNILWNFDNDDVTRNIFGGSIAWRVGIFHEFLPENKIRDDQNRRKFSVRLGLAFAERRIAGDLSSQSNANIRNDFLGTSDRSYRGLEPFFGFRLNNIIAEFTAPIIGDKDDDIDGLTDTQFLFSIRFIGGFSLKLNGKD